MKASKWGIALLFLCCATGMCDVTSVPKHKWTFKFEAPKKLHATGLVKKNIPESELPDMRFKLADVPVPQTVDLTVGNVLSPVLDQGQCGSCVYHSVTANFTDSLLLRGINLGTDSRMSAEFLMTSRLDQGSRCNGSYFTATAPATANGMPMFTDCPYNMGRKGCAANVPLHGKSVSSRVIDPSVKSIMVALMQKYPVSNTIGANGTFQGYSSGIFNACANVGTNHETEIVGASCGTSVDASGNCVFDATGNLPAGVGYYKIRNSWGTSWGENGFYRIAITDSQGRKCNNVADEVGIIETGIPVPTPVPPTPPVPPAPTPFNWGILATIAQIIGALAGVVALVLVLRKK